MPIGIVTDMGQFGAPFLLTSHGTTSNASLSFTFSGTYIHFAILPRLFNIQQNM